MLPSRARILTKNSLIFLYSSLRARQRRIREMIATLAIEQETIKIKICKADSRNGVSRTQKYGERVSQIQRRRSKFLSLHSNKCLHPEGNYKPKQHYPRIQRPPEMVKHHPGQNTNN